MSLSVCQHVLNSDDWVASLEPFLGTLMESFLNCRGVLVRDVLTLGSVNKLATQVSILTLHVVINRLNITDNSGELTCST